MRIDLERDYKGEREGKSGGEKKGSQGNEARLKGDERAGEFKRRDKEEGKRMRRGY